MPNLLLRKNYSATRTGAVPGTRESRSRSGFRRNAKGLFLLSCMALSMFFTHTAQAQATAQIGIGTEVPGNTLYGPVYRFSSTSTTSGARVNMLWTAAEMAAAGISPGSIITGVEFNKTNVASFNGTVPFQMLAANTANTVLTTADTWAGVLATHTQVINNPAYNVPDTAGWVNFTFSTPFTYTGGAFEVATEYALAGLSSPHSTDGFKWEYTTGFADKIAGVASATGATLNGGVAAYKHRPNIKILYTPGVACSGTPVAGTAASADPSVCSGGSTTLTLTGATAAAGIGFQWQSSADGTTFTDITGATTSTYITTQTATTFYRAVVTCNGTNPVNSNVITVTTPALISGNFTINSNTPTGGTNFQTFTDAINHLSCGIGGPVLFTVDPNSGPYNEQIEIMEITGMSAANTITFQGNGRTISADPVSGNRAVIKLNGADYVTINNLNIETLASATYGWGIHFINGADNNTISNNTITIGTTSTTASNSGGIIFANSTSTATTVGNNGNNNVISGNTITGAYRGIRLNGQAAGVGNNQITGNTIRDFYSAGIEIDDANATLIDGNNISRPTRAAVTTFEGIVLSGTTQNTIVSKNRVHNTHGGATSITGSAYGLYSTANDAPVGSENIYRNNLVYNFNNTGTAYGIYNSSSNGVFYYHNTIDMTNPNNTGTVRGMYQTTLATNIQVINNIFTVNAGTSGVKTALYFNTSTSEIISNNNVLYVDPTATNQHIGYWSSSARTTLADWQGANTTTPFDLNSVAADPQYVDAANGNLRPTNNAVNNIGQPLASVTTDITGATRNTTTPDPGAYEFTPATNDAGVTAILSPVSATCGATNQETVTITVQNFGLSPLTNIPVTYQINGGAFVATETIPGPITPGSTLNYDFNTKADLSAGGNFVILAKTMLAGDAIAANDPASVTIDIINPIATFPHLEDFETFTPGTNATGFMNGWEATPSGVTNAFRWNVDIGTTPSSGTGPSVDHTLGTATGKFIFTEASSGSVGDSTVLVSPCVSLPAATPMGIEFWYHMFGGDMGSLYLDVFNGTNWVQNVWVLAGQQQTATTEPWRRASISLASYSGNVIKVRFRAVRGGGFEGDMAIDDVRFYPLPPVELELLSVDLPTNGCGLSATETICVTIKNNGATTLTNFPVSYTVDSGTPVTETVTGSVAPGATLQYCFTTKANFSTAGSYTVSATVNATGDADAANNTATGIMISKPVIATFPYTEGFESGAGHWVAGGTNSSWALGTPTGTIISTAGGGSNSWVTNLSGDYNDNEKSAVTGPCFNFTNVANPMISMKIFWDIETSWDGAVLQSSIDGGTTWQRVGNVLDPTNWYNDSTINAGPGGQPGATAQGWSGTGADGSGGWVTASHALTGLGGQASVQLRIAFASDGNTVDEGFAFDDITISNMIAAPTVTAGGPTTFCQGGSVVLTAASATPGATFTWELNGTPITGATSNTYTATASGSYTAVANAGGTATSTPIVVTVNPAAATPTITAGGSTTFCTGGSVTLTAASTTTGATYEWFLNGTAITGATSATYTANAAGNYTVVATASGCPSVASAATAVTVNATPATPTVTRNGAVLTSSAATGNQWFLDGTAIPGATGTTHTATTNGTYTVVVTGGGCDSDPSAPLVITNLSAGKALAGTNVQVYPNPANGSFNVKLQGYQKDATVVLYNLAGQQITTEKVAADGNAKNIDISGLAAGTYLLKITSDKNVQVTRLVIQ